MNNAIHRTKKGAQRRDDLIAQVQQRIRQGSPQAGKLRDLLRFFEDEKKKAGGVDR